MPYQQYQNCMAIAGSVQLVPFAGLMRLPAPVSGTIINVMLVSRGPVNEIGDATFDCKVNGVSIFADPDDRPQILLGADSGSASLVRGTVPALCAKLDEIRVDLVAVPDGGIGGPLWILVVIDGSLTPSMFVQQLYVGGMGRVPVGSEIPDGAATLEAARTTPAAFVQAVSGFARVEIYTSAEYIARGRTDTQFINDLYLGILGRPADAGGHDYWLSQLITQGGIQTRSQLVDAFVLSSEATNDRMFEMWSGTMLYANAQYVAGYPLLLTDVTDDDILKFVAAGGGKWVNVPIPTGGGGGGSSLTIEEADGTPSVADVTLLKVGNGDLTDLGSGVVRLKTASDVVGGGGYTDTEFIKGLELTWASDYSVTLTPGACYIPGEAAICANNGTSIMLALDVTAFTAAIASDTWYHVYVYKSGSGLLTVVISATAPVFYGVNAAYMTGDDTRRYVGSIRSSTGGGGGPRVLKFHTQVFGQNELTLLWDEVNNAAPFRVLSAGNAVSSTVVSLSDMTPPVMFKRYHFHAQTTVFANDVLNIGIHPAIVPSAAWYAAEWSARADMRNTGGGTQNNGWSFPPGSITLAARSLEYITGYISNASLYIDSKGFTVRR